MNSCGIVVVCKDLFFEVRIEFSILLFIIIRTKEFCLY